MIGLRHYWYFWMQSPFPFSRTLLTSALRAVAIVLLHRYEVDN